MTDTLLLHRISEEMEYYKYMEEIPFFSVKEGWEIKLSPPLGGAMVRCRIKKQNKEVSIYLDCHDNLAPMGQPYWEIYSFEDDIQERYLMNEIKELEETITRFLE